MFSLAKMKPKEVLVRDDDFFILSCVSAGIWRGTWARGPARNLRPCFSSLQSQFPLPNAAE